MILGWSPSKIVSDPSTKMAPTAELSLAYDPMGNSHKNLLVWNQQLNQNQTLMEQSLDGPLPKLCPAVALSHQDGHHSAVTLLLKAALIQVSDYRLLGASGTFFPSIFQSVKGIFTVYFSLFFSLLKVFLQFIFFYISVC